MDFNKTLELHKLWLVGDTKGVKANLSWTNLSGANLSGTNLIYTTGNMEEVKSAQFDKWVCVWYNDPEQGTTLNIGCQSHKLELWIKSDPRWIATLDKEATEWWAKYRDVLLKLVEISMIETKDSTNEE